MIARSKRRRRLVKLRKVIHVRRRPAPKEEAVDVALTLRYWREGPLYVGEILEVRDVFSQGRTLAELRRNIREAWELMLEERPLSLRQRA